MSHAPCAMRGKACVAAIAIAAWIWAAIAGEPKAPEPVPGCEVTPINDGDYFPAAIEAIEGAKRSIRCVMFLANDSANPRHKERRILEALIAAHKRGVQVEAVLDLNKAHWKEDETEREKLEKKNGEAIARLKDAGVPVFTESPETTTHAKVLVADGETVILGSANWTGAALARNHEANVRIRSKEVAKRYLEWIDSIEKQPVKNSEESTVKSEEQTKKEKR